MLNRLEWMTIQPSVILDIGCGTGECAKLLQNRYPDAKVLPWDMSQNMVGYANQQSPSPFYVCADAQKLPLGDQSVDLVFANFVLPWHTDFTSLLNEWRRVLRNDGILIFTALGLDTLKEWRTFFADAHIPCLIDMHDIGDLLLQEGFADPVLDVSYFTTAYRKLAKLAHELRATGMWFPDRKALQETSLEAAGATEDRWTVTYEIIFGHAFAPALNKTNSTTGETKVSLNQMRDLLRGR